jgi:hypothetical protein
LTFKGLHGIISQKIEVFSFFKVGYLTTLSVSRLYSFNDRMNNEYRTVGGMKDDRGNQLSGRKHVLLPLCPPQIPHDLTFNAARATEVGSRRLTALAMARNMN